VRSIGQDVRDPGGEKARSMGWAEESKYDGWIKAGYLDDEQMAET
jgi:hypothetical protein